MTKIIHFCASSYETGCVGGVARFDDHVKRAFPHRIHFSQRQIREMYNYLNKNRDAIVITDNQLSVYVPNQIKTIIFHHGSARTNWERTYRNHPDGNAFYRNYVEPQQRMLTYRNPSNTIIASISTACTEYFTNYYGKQYTKFKRYDIFHTSEFDENNYKLTFNESPIVLGNWLGKNKGKDILPILKSKAKEFTFKQLDIKPASLSERDLNDFTQKKQEIYNSADIFLQISNCEGNAYSTLDALICGLPIVASDVGLFYKDVPDNCFVKLDWKRNGDEEYVRNKLLYAWENKEILSKNARNWYMQNYRYVDWLVKVRKMVDDFSNI